jgi:RNA recognition motif-containing protein
VAARAGAPPPGPSSLRTRSREVKTIYLGNLPYSSTEDDLREMFASHGEVLEVDLIPDPDTGLHKGFGFVKMDAAAAMAAIDALDGSDFRGRVIRVNEARNKGLKAPRRTF